MNFALKQSKSDAKREIEAGDQPERTKRFKMNQLHARIFEVPVVKRSAQAAIEFWKPLHYGLFALTILLRCLLCRKDIQRAKLEYCHIKHGTQRIEQSRLFRKYRPNCNFKQPELETLCKAICEMHSHSVSAEGDLAHTATDAIVRNIDATWKK